MIYATTKIPSWDEKAKIAISPLLLYIYTRCCGSSQQYQEGSLQREPLFFFSRVKVSILDIFIRNFRVWAFQIAIDSITLNFKGIPAPFSSLPSRARQVFESSKKLEELERIIIITVGRKWFTINQNAGGGSAPFCFPSFTLELIDAGLAGWWKKFVRSSRWWREDQSWPFLLFGSVIVSLRRCFKLFERRD